jgi:hypothetical protein
VEVAAIRTDPFSFDIGKDTLLGCRFVVDEILILRNLKNLFKDVAVKELVGVCSSVLVACVTERLTKNALRTALVSSNFSLSNALILLRRRI